jgi:FixJ family two-component response regulator
MENATARILLADDDEAFLRSMTSLIRQEGYRCDSAPGTAQALTALEMQPYDLLIANLNMPGNQELEFLRANHRLRPAMPMIVVTDVPSVQTAIDALRLGVVDYLVKPVDFSDLLHSIRLALNKRSILQVVCRTREELQRRLEDLKAFEQAVSLSAADDFGGGPAWLLQDYVQQAVDHITSVAASIARTLEIVQQGGMAQAADVCTVLNCPRRSMLEQGLLDAVATIYKTKSAFKSRELGRLRERLEALLKSVR